MKWLRESNVKEKPCEQKRDDQKHKAVLKNSRKTVRKCVGNGMSHR